MIRIPPHCHVNALTAAAVLGGVVQQIAEHLPHPLGITGNGRKLFIPIVIVQNQTFSAEKFAVGIYSIFQLGLQVHGLHRQGEAAVFNAGKFQKLFHHVGQAACFRNNDVHALFHVVGIPHFPVHNGLRPTVDGGQGGAKLMGDRGNKFRLGLFRLGDLQRHIIDGIGQVTDLILVFLFHLNAIASGCDLLCNFGNAGHRFHDGTHKIQVGEIHDGKNHQCDGAGRQNDGQDLLIHQLQRGHHAHHADHNAVVNHGRGNRHNALPGVGVLARPDPHVLGRDGFVNVRGPGVNVRHQAGCGLLDASVSVQKLQFQMLLHFKGGNVATDVCPVFIFGVVLQKTGGRSGGIFQAGGHTGVVVTGHGGRKGGHRHKGDHNHHRDGVEHPASADTADAFGSFFLHVRPPFFSFCGKQIAEIRIPTCSRSPRLS